MDIRKEYEQSEFLKFSPLERMKIMHQLLAEIIAIKAKAEGVAEYEIYRRYLKNNPRHYHKDAGDVVTLLNLMTGEEKEKTVELAKKTGRNKKLEMLISHSQEEPVEDTTDSPNC